MRRLLPAILFISFLSCQTKNEPGGMQLLIPDSANNMRGKWDWNDMEYRSKLASQIGLSDLKKGADSLEIRLWYDFSLGNSQDLYVLKFVDTSCLLSYYQVYPRPMHSFANPIVDSVVSKTVLLTNNQYKELPVDSVWLLKSQSELNIPNSIGFTDCYSYILEVADRKRFKYMRHHCSMSYYEQIKLPQILSYINFCYAITALAHKYHVIVSQHQN